MVQFLLDKHALSLSSNYWMFNLNRLRMNLLSTWLTYVGLTVVLIGTEQHVRDTSIPITDAKLSEGNAGYFFALRQVALSQKKYIFFADPLKRAVFTHEDNNIALSYTMTVKNVNGFSMYFSGADYNVILTVKDLKQISEGTIVYKGTLFVRHGAEKHKFAVHGFQNR